MVFFKGFSRVYRVKYFTAHPVILKRGKQGHQSSPGNDLVTFSLLDQFNNLCSTVRSSLRIINTVRKKAEKEKAEQQVSRKQIQIMLK